MVSFETCEDFEKKQINRLKDKQFECER